MVSYNPRFFRLRYAPGFTEEMLRLIREGYSEWQDRIRSTIAQWETKGIKRTEPPEYTFREIELSPDRTVASIKIEGDPRSYGALKLFEDGVPQDLFYKLPREVQKHTEMSYENPAVNILPGRWLPTDYVFRH